jgi:hypothetical protein
MVVNADALLKIYAPHSITLLAVKSLEETKLSHLVDTFVPPLTIL